MINIKNTPLILFAVGLMLTQDTITQTIHDHSPATSALSEHNALMRDQSTQTPSTIKVATITAKPKPKQKSRSRKTHSIVYFLKKHAWEKEHSDNTIYVD